MLQRSKDMPRKTSQEALDQLSQISANQIDDFLRRSSITFLECAINLMATHMSKEEIVATLEKEAKLVNEMG
jgi:hypothetical protein